MRPDVRVTLQGIPFDDLNCEAQIRLAFPDGSCLLAVLKDFIGQFAREEVQCAFTRRFSSIDTEGVLGEPGDVIQGEGAQ